MSLPIALTIAGSDPSGGAGIQADIKTFSALGVYGASVVTALTAQNTCGVTGIFPVPTAFIADQFRAVISDLKISAIKTGMLGDAPTVEMVVRLLAETPDLPVVVDPVMVATSGDVLLPPSAVEAVRSRLVPRATLITPNIPEAAALLGRPSAASLEEMCDQAKQLMQLGCGAVLLKGGHATGKEAIDVLYDGARHHVLARPMIKTANTHGTGCTLSAAIAAGMATGATLYDAVAAAKLFVWNALASGATRTIGNGHGPLDHQFALRIPNTGR